MYTTTPSFATIAGELSDTQHGARTGPANAHEQADIGGGFPVGTEVAPSGFFSGDTDNGFFRGAADEFAFSQGGVEGARFLRVGGTLARLRLRSSAIAANAIAELNADEIGGTINLDSRSSGMASAAIALLPKGGDIRLAAHLANWVKVSGGAGGVNPAISAEGMAQVGVQFVLSINATGVIGMKRDADVAALETAVLIRRKDAGGVAATVSVTLGAVDSGGAGFRLLRVAN